MKKKPSPKSAPAPQSKKSKLLSRIARENNKARNVASSKRCAKAAKLGSFRVKKSDRGKLVLLNSRGHRVPPSRVRPSGSYIVVAVTPSGKKKIVGRDFRTRDLDSTVKLGKLSRLRVSSLKPYRVRGAKKAARQLVEGLGWKKLAESKGPKLAPKAPRAPRKSPSKRRGSPRKRRAAPVEETPPVPTLNPWNELGALGLEIAKQAELAGGGRGAVLRVEVTFTFTIGKRSYTRTVSATFSCHILSGPALVEVARKFARSVMYAAIAQAIANEKGVTKGSRDHIRSLPINAGKKSGLKKSTGRGSVRDAWDKEKLRTASVVAWEWKIDRAP